MRNVFKFDRTSIRTRTFLMPTLRFDGRKNIYFSFTLFTLYQGRQKQSYVETLRCISVGIGGTEWAVPTPESSCALSINVTNKKIYFNNKKKTFSSTDYKSRRPRIFRWVKLRWKIKIKYYFFFRDCQNPQSM